MSTDEEFEWNDTNSYIKLNRETDGNLLTKYISAPQQHEQSELLIGTDFVRITYFMEVSMEDTDTPTSDTFKPTYKYFQFMTTYPQIHRIGNLNYLETVEGMVLFAIVMKSSPFKHTFDVDSLILRCFEFFKLKNRINEFQNAEVVDYLLNLIGTNDIEHIILPPVII